MYISNRSGRSIVITHSVLHSWWNLEHTCRLSTSACHLTLFCAVCFTSHHVSCLSSNSAILVCLQVCWGLPLLHFPCGFHSMTLLAMNPSGVVSVWPIQRQAVCLISCSIGHCTASLQLKASLDCYYIYKIIQTVSPEKRCD